MEPLFEARENQRRARIDLLYNKPVSELVRMIVELEEENQKTKEYRKRLMQIRNIATPQEERSRPGRPKRNIEGD